MVEVTNVSIHGFWLLLDTEKLFVPYVDFPWFKKVPIANLAHFERPQPHHLYWPELDLDPAVESIRDPAKFPLISKTTWRHCQDFGCRSVSHM